MLTIGSTLTIFLALGISSVAVFWAKRLHLPHTVLLVVIGVVLGILSLLSPLSFLGEFSLTPELLFYLLLPTLIFESAYNINVRRLIEDVPIILLLSIISLVLSTTLIAGFMYGVFLLLGLHVPFIILLIFGALISATDPVAVLALFKEYGAPKRLSRIFEGESLFNDATAVALFLILLGVADTGFTGVDTIINGIITFTSMLIGGVFFGICIGAVFSKIVGLSRESEIASITLTLVLAHITFILAEYITQYLSIGSFDVSISPIIATTVSALLMGNYGRSKIHPKAEAFVEKLWEQLAFWANSLIFILIGVLFVGIPSLSGFMLPVIASTIVLVALARAVSIYPVVFCYNVVADSSFRIPASWQHLLSWGSLRGALAVTMVLLIPDEFSVSQWVLPLTPKEFLLSLTIGCIAATLLVKATTIKYFIKRLKLDSLTDIELVELQEARALIHHEAQLRVKKYEERGYINPNVALKLHELHARKYQEACTHTHNNTKELAHRVLRMYAIGIEQAQLKQLYHYGEVNESVFRRLQGKLQLQLEAIEGGNLSPDTSLHLDKKDVFDRLANFIQSIISPTDDTEKIDNKYLYYRAQSILARKALKELHKIDTENAEFIFTRDALVHVDQLYSTFRNQSEKKMHALVAEYPERYQALSERLALCGLRKIEEKTLSSLYNQQLISTKLFITLSEEL